MDLTKMTRAELAETARGMGLGASGTKAELAARIERAEHGVHGAPHDMTRTEAARLAKELAWAEMRANGFDDYEDYHKGWGSMGTQCVAYFGEDMTPCVVAVRWASGETPRQTDQDVRRCRQLALSWLLDNQDYSEVTVRLALVRVDTETVDLPQVATAAVA